MKNKRLIKILAVIASCLLLVGAVIGISVAAEETAPSIEYKNLAYEGAVQIVYYVNTNDLPSGYTVKLATWFEGEDPKKALIKEAESFTKFVGETEYTIFASKGIAPKMMRDTVYAQTVLYNAENAEVARGEVTEYSIYTYVKNRILKGSTVDQKALYHALVDYGASVQKVLRYKTSVLANDMFMDYSKLTIVEPKTTTTYLNYNEVAGTWSKGSKESHQYIVVHGMGFHTELGLDGNSFVYTKPIVIESITGAGNTITWKDVDYKAGSTIPKDWLGLSWGYGDEKYASFNVQHKESTTGDILAVFDTNLKVTDNGITNATAGAGLHIYINATPNSYPGNDPTIANTGITLNASNFAIRKLTATNANDGADAVYRAYGSTVNLRIVARAVEGDSTKATLTLYVDGVEVNSVTSSAKNVTSYPNPTPGSLFFMTCASARNLEMTFTDTTFVNYTYFNEIPGTNAVRPSATAVPGTNTTEQTATLNGKTVGYEIRYTNAWDEATQSYVFSKGAYITSIDGAESITVGGKTLKVGDALWRPHGYNGTELYTKITAVVAGLPVDGSIFQFKTDLVIESSCVNADGDYTNNVLLGINSADSNYNNFMIINKGGNVLFGNTDTGVAFGEKFELVIRGYNSATEGKYDIKYYVNGLLILTKTIDVKPTAVQFKSYSQTADMSLTFTNTYCDSYDPDYRKPTDYTDTKEVVLIGGNQTAITYLVHDASAGTYTKGNADTFTYKIEWKNGPYGTSSDSSYVWSNQKLITGIWDKDGNVVEKLTYGSTSYQIGSVLPKTAFGFSDTNSTWYGNGASLKFYPNMTIVTDDTTAPLFVYETDIKLQNITAQSGYSFNLFVEGGIEGKEALANIRFRFDGGGSGQPKVCSAVAGNNIGSEKQLDLTFGSGYTKNSFHVKIEVTENATDSTKMDVTYTLTYENAGVNSGDSPYTTTVTVAKADITRVAVSDVSDMRNVKATFTNTICYEYTKAEE